MERKVKKTKTKNIIIPANQLFARAMYRTRMLFFINVANYFFLDIFSKDLDKYF